MNSIECTTHTLRHKLPDLVLWICFDIDRKGGCDSRKKEDRKKTDEPVDLTKMRRKENV
jgi:hypothetical protein